jgi:hypothetical protein
MLVPPEVKGIPLKSGDASVFAVTVSPFESSCAGSKVDLTPLRPVITILTGMTSAATVVEVPVEGALPTMLYLYVTPLKLKEPFHVVSGVAAASIGVLAARKFPL